MLEISSSKVGWHEEVINVLDCVSSLFVVFLNIYLWESDFLIEVHNLLYTHWNAYNIYIL